MIDYTIVGGFLGSGKTTLINAMLTTATQRLAVIVNDIGEINIDAALFANRSEGSQGSKPDTIELTNGCVCCSIGDSLASTLRELCTGDSPPDHVVLECSGAADPGRTAAYGSRRVLNEPCIVVTVDATDVRNRAEDVRFKALIGAQLTGADQLVVTKTDLLSVPSSVPASGQPESDPATALTAWLSERTDATVTVGHPQDVGAALELTPSSAANRASAAGTQSNTPLRVETRHFDGLVEATEIESWLAQIDGLIRAKGIVATPSGPILVQWAAGRCSREPWSGLATRAGIVTIS